MVGLVNFLTALLLEDTLFFQPEGEEVVSSKVDSYQGLSAGVVSSGNASLTARYMTMVWNENLSMLLLYVDFVS